MRACCVGLVCSMVSKLGSIKFGWHLVMIKCCLMVWKIRKYQIWLASCYDQVFSSGTERDGIEADAEG